MRADHSARESFAAGCVHDLEALLDPKKSRFRLKGKLDLGADKRLALGRVQGAKLIKVKFEQKYNPNRWALELRERYQLICKLV